MKQSQFTPEEMLGYRDQIVQNLRKELELLDDLQKKNLFNKDEGIFTRKSYPEKVGVIRGEIQKLENFDVVLSVVGTMKAGKSTTINAIVGREILPNRNRPMTALPTLIYHNAAQKEPVLSFHNTAVVKFVQKLKNQLEKNAEWQKHHELSTKEMQKLMKSIKDDSKFFKETYQGENEIFEFLAKLNDLVRLSEIVRQQSKDIQFPFEQCKEISQLPKIEVAFRHLVDMPANQGRLVLLDTPGPNEAGQTRLKKILEEQLKRSSAVLLVLDYTQLKSEASASVKEQVVAISEKLQKDRLFALVNKFDQKNANSDDEEATKDIIFNDFLKDKIEREHIFPLSSHRAFLANRMAQELELKGEKPKFDEKKWVADFVEVAFGEIEADEWNKKITVADVQRKIERIIKRSKVQEPLDNAIRKTQLEAPRIAIQSALAQLQELLKEVHNFCNISLGVAKKETEEEIKKYEQMIKRVEKHITTLEGLKSDADTMICEFRNSIQTNLDTTLKNKKSNIISDAKKRIDEIVNEIKEVYKGAYDDSKYSKFYWTKDEYNKIRQSFYQAAAVKELLSDNTLVFAQKDFAINFDSGVRKMFDFLIKESMNDLSETYAETINSMKNNLNSIDENVKTTLNQIEEEFLIEHIQVELYKPSIVNSLELDNSNAEFGQLFREASKSVEVDKKGFWADVVRFFGGNPKETIPFDYYKIDIKAMYDQLYLFLNKKIEPIEIQIQELFDSFSDDWKNEYIGKITSRAEDLKDEAKNQLAELKQGKFDKELYKAEVEALQVQTQKLQDEMKDLNKKFGVAASNKAA